MSKTVVVNLRSQAFDVYIGRGSPFGNPYRIGPDGDRAEVIEKYRAYFRAKMERSATFRRQVEALREKRLGCYCHPLVCHGDVIVQWLEEHSDETDQDQVAGAEAGGPDAGAGELGGGAGR